MVKVLIVEDDLMIADATEEILVKSGYEVCGIARTVVGAVALGRTTSPIWSSSICGWPMADLAPISRPNYTVRKESASSTQPAISRTSS